MIRVSRDKRRHCDACATEQNCVYVTLGGKSFRICQECIGAVTDLWVRLLTNPDTDSLEKYA